MNGLTTSGGLIIAFGGVPLMLFARDSLDVSTVISGDKRLQDDLLKWAVTGFLVAYVLAVEEQSLQTLGLVIPGQISIGFLGAVSRLLVWWSGGVIGTIVLSTVAYNLFRHYDMGTQDEFAAEQAARPLPAFLFTAITAGVTESLLYQAYPIERLTALSSNVLAAGLIAWVVFSAGHFVGGRFSVEETVFTSVPALVVTVLYVLSGSVYVVIFVHTTVNALSFLSQ